MATQEEIVEIPSYLKYLMKWCLIAKLRRTCETLKAYFRLGKLRARGIASRYDWSIAQRKVLYTEVDSWRGMTVALPHETCDAHPDPKVFTAFGFFPSKPPTYFLHTFFTTEKPPK